jgi:hypothetical protein
MSKAVIWAAGVPHPAACVSNLVSTGRAVASQYWSGGFFPEYGSSLLRYYVDSERQASLVLPLGLAHGMAAAMDDNAPWSAGALMGKSGVGFTGWGAAEAAAVRQHFSQQRADDPVQNTSGSGGSGLFNNYQVPFSTNITVTIEMAGTPNHLVIFWMVLRGRTHATLHLPETPDVLLPPTARLKSYYNPTTVLQPLEQFVLYNSSATNGAVLLVTLSVSSGPSPRYPSFKYLEGCMRSYSPSGQERFRISSGTEDYFLGTFYFDKGQYFFPEAGVTSLCPPTVRTNPSSIACTPAQNNGSKFAAYRLHVGGDPLLFEGGAVQTWRNGDVRGCPWPSKGTEPTKGDAPVINASSLALLYEWK